MKIQRILNVLIIALLVSVSACQVEEEGNYQTANFKVWGNCEMCKETIESSMKGQDGIKSSDWDVKTKLMVVKYDSASVKVSEIHKKIASVGYDTELEKGDDKAYNSLHSCCQYERKK